MIIVILINYQVAFFLQIEKTSLVKWKQLKVLSYFLFTFYQESKILAPIILNEFIPELMDKKIIEINAATEISSFLYCNSNE